MAARSMLSWPAWAIPRRRAHEPLLIMAKPDRSRLAPTALAVFGIVVFAVLGVLLGVVHEGGWISQLFLIGFALALLVEIASRLQESIRLSRRRLWQAFWFVLGVIIFAVVAYREGWEAVLFLLMFLAIWQLATFEPAGHL